MGWYFSGYWLTEQKALPAALWARASATIGWGSGRYSHNMFGSFKYFILKFKSSGYQSIPTRKWHISKNLRALLSNNFRDTLIDSPSWSNSQSKRQCHVSTQRQTPFFFFFKKYIYLLCIQSSVCVYACPSEEGTRSHIWLWATIWLLGIELKTSGRAVSALNL